MALGPMCRECGATGCLTFDCIRPTGGTHHKLNPANRMTFYMRQAQAGNLQVLCSDCNSRKGAKLGPKYTAVRLA
jgi:5-methylcytosine-specific restriction endonuclease McrA